MEVEHDIEAILGDGDDEDEEGLLTEFRRAHDVAGLSARFRAAQRTYFEEDVAGYTSGRTVNNLGAMIAIVRGEDSSEAFEYAGRKSKDELVGELQNALDEAGFEEHEMGTSSVGRELPLMVAILSNTHGVGIPQSLSAHSDLIDYEYE